MLELFDTHCHIHFPDYELDPEEVIKSAREDGVNRLLLVGCTLTDSKLAVKMAQQYDNIWASIGLHPHEAKEYINDQKALQEFRDLASKPKVVAVGETGLDYHYQHSDKDEQKAVFRFQLTLAEEFNLPLIFHVRGEKTDPEAVFNDFLAILSDFEGVRGVVHSFSASKTALDKLLAQGLYIGLNGIMTFTTDLEQLEAAKSVPLSKLLLETDAPFLTPKPFRGTICQPKHVRVTAEFVSKLRGEKLETLADATTKNARKLLGV